MRYSSAYSDCLEGKEMIRFDGFRISEFKNRGGCKKVDCEMRID